MSGGYNMPGGGPEEMEPSPNTGFESLLAQLRRTSSNRDNGPSNQPAQSHQNQSHDLLSQFNPYQHQIQPPYYNQQHSESPRMEDSFSSSMALSQLPAAPTPPASGFPNFGPASLGSVGSGHNIPGRATSGHLLDLLKFSGPGSQVGPVQVAPVLQDNLRGSGPGSAILASSAPALIHAPAPGPSDPTGLLAALMMDSLKDEPVKPEPEPSSNTWSSTSQSNETQQYLLSLLNRPKPGHNDGQYSAESSKSISLTPQSTSEHAAEHTRDYSSIEERTGADPVSAPIPPVPTSSFDFESPKPKFQEEVPATKSSIFNYSNPFDDLAATSPLNRTPKSSTTPGASGSAATGHIQILKKPASGSQQSTDTASFASPDHKRRKAERASPFESFLRDSTPVFVPTDPAASPAKAKETVSAAVNELAGKADKEAQEALARAEEEQAQAEIAKDLENLNHAKTDEEFDEAARVAGQAIKKELEKEENQNVLEKTLSPELAKAVRETVDEAANGPVADSWESAEAEVDEIVVIEEPTEPPIKVYNFPMRPWISITVQDNVKHHRPEFLDSAILDIARLKKDFDQIDRNLVTATEGYIGYGMSKAGGLRVIRQHDGKDAKLFTDTKDRIFNVAMSSSVADQNRAQKDAIIGTGISGTVYWVQIRDGSMDHMDDANPEQYGFALSPVNSQEGDAPGGVLKTRSRTSTNHPEYFAVGRGKSITIVWPNFILQHNLFKPGHDRVVDTEKLAKQCSLKINTGKAGKDFTFSQDDTLVVSLDKSGRVKFWDVRDLTAAKDPEAANLMPATTSLEVKEPLMTLTTTPEGEKAWPTSVLLLDKLRPYQRNCALRYMIVGMKQNHTLQLWDLALGKPVQEFNLPHGKESDAVCSIMYHPPTGIITVGHPTRNSIYFLHLSAPKYAMKTYSQVDYTQRLTAQDSSIPTPESTAVISGIREYSLANRGMLRSLDILSDPCKPVNDKDADPTLFELYAMTSTGVTCLFVKKRELGWGKDSRVGNAVDAVEAGIVKLGKLNSPPQPTPATGDSRIGDDSTPAQKPRIIASRSGGKDSLHNSTTHEVAASRKGVDVDAPAKSKTDTKEEDPSLPSEKPKERKRNRKEKAPADAQTEREVNVHSNASGHSPRLGPAKQADSNKTFTLHSAMGADATDSRIDSMGSQISERVSGSLHAAFGDIKKALDAQFLAREVDFEAKQRRLLDMVSETLNHNTEQVLGNIVRKELAKIIPSTVREDMTKAISEQLGTKFAQTIAQSVVKEMKATLPTTINHAVNKDGIAKAVTDKVVNAVSNLLDKQSRKLIDENSALNAKDMSKGVSDKVVSAVSNLLDRQSRKLMDENPALNAGDMSNAVSAKVAETVTGHMERQLHMAMEQLLPAVTDVVGQSLHRASQENDQRERIAQLEQYSQMQSAKIDNLTTLVSGLSETISAMAASQTQYQTQLLKFQATKVAQQQPTMQLEQAQQSQPAPEPHGGGNSVYSYRSPAASRISYAPSANSPRDSSLSQQLVFAPKSREERDRLELQQMVETLDDLLKEGRYDEGMMQWLQSTGREQELFGIVLIKYQPEIVTKHLQALVLLSVGTTIANGLDDSLVLQRLAWIEVVVLQFYPMVQRLDDQTREITPKILGHIKTRVEQVFMRISNVAANDPALKNIAQMTNVINRAIEATTPRIHY